MPRRPEQFEEIRTEKRKLILDTALRLFADRGYASTSISTIAKEAGISKGLMYNYFESKEDLLKKIMTDFIGEMTGAMDPNRDGHLDDHELANALDFFFGIFRTRRDELKLYYQLSFQPEVMQYLTQSPFMQTSVRLRNMFVDYLSAKFPDDPQVAMLNMTSILKGFSLIYIYAPDNFPDELVDRYRDYLKGFFIGKQKNEL